MSLSRIRPLVVLGLVIALTGAGCAWFGSKDGSTPEQKTAALEAAEAIQFIPGDTFEIRQTVLGFGAFIPDLLNSQEGVRKITIKRFAPLYHAELDWTLEATRETEGSKKLRAAYEAELKRNPDTKTPPPTMATERVTTSGQLLGINLRTSHAAFLPTYWPEGTHDMLGEKTGIWLSRDAYMELSRTNRTILNLGVFDESLNRAVKNVVELKGAIDAMRAEASEQEAYSDLTLLDGAEVIEWPLTVNGEQKTVSAIRARNWFGEVVVLNSLQNPMILKVTLNPLAAGMDAAAGNGASVMDRLFGYEVNNIELKRP